MTTVHDNVKAIQRIVTSLSWDVEYEELSPYEAIVSTAAQTGLSTGTVGLVYIGFNRARRGLRPRTRGELLIAHVYERRGMKI